MALASYPSTSIWSLRRVREDPLAFLSALAASGEDVVPCHLGRRRTFLLNHPAHVEDVLVRHPDKFIKGRAFDRARKLLGNGLLTAAGPLHARQRRVVQPAFHRQRLSDYTRIVVAHAARLQAGWNSGTPIDVGRSMRDMTLGIVGEALFGVDLSTDAADVQRAVNSALSNMDGLIALLAPGRGTRNARNRLDVIVEGLIERRRTSAEASDDLLSLLLESSPSDESGAAEQIRDDVITILLAGHDTIGHALTWAWMLLAQHPDVEARLDAELRAVAGEGAPAADHLPRLQYTRSVLAETLRLFPPAWVIVRMAASAHRCGNVDIPQGSLVLASPFVTHRDVRFFSEPLAFKPDRWLTLGDEGTSHGAGPRLQHKLSFFPFGAGPRSCVGEGFAWMEGTLALAVLARRWKLRPLSDEAVSANPAITLRPARPVLMLPRARS